MDWNKRRRSAGSPYHGPVVYSNECHYAVGSDGHPDLRKPLRFVDGGYVLAAADDPTHRHVYELRIVELEQGEPE